MTGFIFNGVSSKQYELNIGWVDTAESSEDSGLTVDVQRGEMNMVRSTPNQYGTKYKDTLHFSFGIFKKDYSSFTMQESRAINNWLRGPNTYKVLQFDDQSPESIHFYAICTELQDIILNGHSGKMVSFVCNSPFGYADKKHVSIDVSGEKSFNIYNNSDDGIYYPTIAIKCQDDYVDDFSIAVGDDGEIIFDFSECDEKEITINGKNSAITDKEGNLIPLYKLGLNDVAHLYWPRLQLNENAIVLSGTGTVDFEFEFPRKVGVV